MSITNSGVRLRQSRGFASRPSRTANPMYKDVTRSIGRGIVQACGMETAGKIWQTSMLGVPAITLHGRGTALHKIAALV